MTSVVHFLSWLTPSAAAGIAVIGCVCGVFFAQAGATGRRELTERRPVPGDPAFTQAHARAAAARARAKAEAAEFASTAFLVTSACVASHAIVLNFTTQAIGALALLGCTYQLGDAGLSYLADRRSIREDEMFDDFAAREPEPSATARWQNFARLHPKAARRLLQRRPGAADELIPF